MWVVFLYPNGAIMIRIKQVKSTLDVSGHAKRAPGVPAGNNIVCAAVSALTLTLVESLSEVAGMKVSSAEQKGHVYVM